MRGDEVPAGTRGRPRPAQAIRNVALVGPSGAGKTVLVEALRGAAGLAHDEAAHAPGALHISTLEHLGVKVNLLDAPGSPDFVGALRAGLRAADGVLFVVSAVGGLDPVTAQLWQECADTGVARAVAVTQLDCPGADFDETVALCQRLLDEAVLPICLPMHDDGGGVGGLLTLLDQRVVDSTSGTRITRAADPEHLRLIADLRAELVEAVLEHSEDESLLDDYLLGAEPEPATLTGQAHRAVVRADLTVALATAAPAGVGLVELLDFLVSAFPSPLERLCPPATRPDGSPVSPLSADPEGPLAAEILCSTGDPPDRMSYVRVWSGVLRPGVDALCSAGDICPVPARTRARTGDTVYDPAEPLLLEPWALPEPQLPIAVQAAAGADGERLRAALDLIADEDPTVRLERRPDTGQQLIWCVGPAHAEGLLDRLRSSYGLAVLTPPVQIAVRCTLAGPVTVTGRHTAASGELTEVVLDCAPGTQGSGLVFITADPELAGSGASMESAVRAEAAVGTATGGPLVDVHVVLVAAQPGSASLPALRDAAVQAVRRAVAEAGTLPVKRCCRVSITVPTAFVRSVLSDLTGRQARILASGPALPDNEVSLVHAELPEVELLTYAAALRAVSHGTGNFTSRTTNAPIA